MEQKKKERNFCKGCGNYIQFGESKEYCIFCQSEDFLKTLEDKPLKTLEDKKFMFKILLIGENKVGRSTLLKDLNVLYKDRMITLGVDFYLKELRIKEKRVVLRIWNVSTNKAFRHLLHSFIKGSNGVLLMFDITNLDTLMFLSNFPQLLREHAGVIPILLVGNKIDKENEREVSKEAGITFAKNNELIGFIEISAKKGQNCENVFEILTKNLINLLGRS